MKKRKLFSVLLLLSMTVAAGAYAGTPDDTEAEKLMDKADYHYGLLEDYQGALRYLEGALEKAESRRIKAAALLKTAYVYWLMGKEPVDFRQYIEKALAFDPALEPGRINYKKSFIEIFYRVKKKPRHYDKKIPGRPGKVLPGKVKKRKKLFVKVELNYLIPADNNFKDVYGPGKLFPRLKAGFLLGKNIYLWGAYGQFPATGEIPGTQLEAKSKQQFISLGPGFKGTLSGKWAFRLDAGVIITHLREEALEMEFSQSVSGFEVNGGFIFNPGNTFFIEISFGYSYASEFAYDREFKVGGFRSGIGLGVKI